MQTLRARVHGESAILAAHPHSHQTGTIDGMSELRIRHRPETPLRVPPAEPHGRQAVHVHRLRLQVREQVDAPVAPQVALERVPVPVLRLRVRVQVHAQPEATPEETRSPAGHAAQPGRHAQPGHRDRRGGQPARSATEQETEPAQSVSTTTSAPTAAAAAATADHRFVVAGRRRQQQRRTPVTVLHATAVTVARVRGRHSGRVPDLSRVVHVLDDHQTHHGNGRLPGRISGHQEQQQQLDFGRRQDGRTAPSSPSPNPASPAPQLAVPSSSVSTGRRGERGTGGRRPDARIAGARRGPTGRLRRRRRCRRRVGTVKLEQRLGGAVARRGQQPAQGHRVQTRTSRGRTTALVAVHQSGRGTFRAQSGRRATAADGGGHGQGRNGLGGWCTAGQGRPAVAASAPAVVVAREGRRDARVPSLRHHIQGERHVFHAHGLPQLQRPVRVQPVRRDHCRQVFLFRSHRSRAAQLSRRHRVSHERYLVRIKYIICTSPTRPGQPKSTNNVYNITTNYP